jgi:hypothetical protein
VTRDHLVGARAALVAVAVSEAAAVARRWFTLERPLEAAGAIGAHVGSAVGALLLAGVVHAVIVTKWWRNW